ncbi:hypothetical protein R3P38DRAFT_3221845 [Favolaschia claudopus]|uniref:Uncharacterized protein n=1 Tax=Favolaschia claudopus TaxID=2862362 RepID=A0AAV9ZZL9_9AGAR
MLRLSPCASESSSTAPHRVVVPLHRGMRRQISPRRLSKAHLRPPQNTLDWVCKAGHLPPQPRTARSPSNGGLSYIVDTLNLHRQRFKTLPDQSVSLSAFCMSTLPSLGGSFQPPLCTVLLVSSSYHRDFWLTALHVELVTAVNAYRAISLLHLKFGRDWGMRQYSYDTMLDGSSALRTSLSVRPGTLIVFLQNPDLIFLGQIVFNGQSTMAS